MKNRTIRLAVCAAMTTLMLAFSACGTKETTKENTTVETTETETQKDTAAETTETETQEDTTAAEDSAAVTGKYKTMDEFAASDEVQSQISSLKESMAEGGMDIAITGEDNKLIYSYTYRDMTKSDELATALADGLESQADTFKGIASTLSMAVEVENPVVVVEYIDSNGEVIVSQEFTAD